MLRPEVVLEVLDPQVILDKELTGNQENSSKNNDAESSEHLSLTMEKEMTRLCQKRAEKARLYGVPEENIREREYTPDMYTFVDTPDEGSSNQSLLIDSPKVIICNFLHCCISNAGCVYLY